MKYLNKIGFNDYLGSEVRNVDTGYDSSKVIGGTAAVHVRGGKRESHACWVSD